MHRVRRKTPTAPIAKRLVFSVCVFPTFAILGVIYFIMVVGASFFLLAVLCIVIVSCYGGGFGTMPAFNADYFGSANVGKIYGLMITAWGSAGCLGRS